MAKRRYYDLVSLQEHCRLVARQKGMTEVQASRDAGLKDAAIKELTNHEPRLSAVLALCEWIGIELNTYVKCRK